MSILNKLPVDKVGHFLGGAMLFAMGHPFGWQYALGFCAFVGAFKEIVHDWLMDYGTPDFKDFLVTVIGGFFMLIWLQVIAPYFMK